MATGKLEVTAIDLIARGNDLLPNVNRWRGQIQLEEIDQAELDDSRRRIQLGDVEGDYVELVGPEGTEPRQAILAVMALQDGKAWFFKLWGDAELAQREKDRFEQFVQSVRFVTSDPSGSPSGVHRGRPATSSRGSTKCRRVGRRWRPKGCARRLFVWRMAIGQ